MIPPLYQNPAKDGGVLGWKNCFPTCTAMQIAFETAGATKPTVAQVRAKCLEPDGRPDVTDGTKPSQNIAAAKAFGVTLDGMLMPFDDAWKLGQRTDTEVSMSINYAVISGGPFDASPGFVGLHQIVVTGGLVYDPAADGRRGLPKGPQKWPKELLKRAAGKVPNVGVGRASVVIAKAPTAKPKRYSVLFEPGAFFVYVGNTRHSESFSKATSAPSTAPFLIPWSGGQKRVVEITAGRLQGLRVEPTATHLKLVSK